MNTRPPQLRISAGGGTRVFSADDLPLMIGSVGHADIELPGLQAAQRLAQLGLSGDRFFVRPADGVVSAGIGLQFNQQPLDEAQWLDDGDLLSAGTQGLVFSRGTDGIASLVLQAPPGANATLPPEEEEAPAPAAQAFRPAPERSAGQAPMQSQDAPGTPHEVIAAADFSRREAVSPARRSRLLPALGTTVVVALVAVLWFLFTARAVEIDVSPEPDEMSVAGGLFRFRAGDAWLLRPGQYTVSASRDGYHPASRQFQVGGEANQRFALRMTKLPGLLRLTASPAADVLVTIDGQIRGRTPVGDLELEPGEHLLELRAERYLPFAERIEIEGGGQVQPYQAQLSPNWADVSFSSQPAGATVLIDGEPLGTTPLTAQVDGGAHEVEFRLEGHKRAQADLQVQAGQAHTLTEAVLEKADGLVALDSSPRGATVTVNGAFRGQTPMQVQLSPGRSYRIAFSKAGYRQATRSVDVKSGQDTSISVSLQADVGVVRISASPPDAELYLDGSLRGTGSQQLELPAVPHQLEVRRSGYATRKLSITPRPGLPQNIDVTLMTEEQARLSAIPQRPKSATGQELIFVDAVGQFDMGASRREQGRRANESEYRVELTRAFYVSDTEVTNRQYRQFKPGHNSGRVSKFTLNGDDQPVVGVSWDSAARFCNWLSERDSLPRAYQEKDGKMLAVSPMNNGYRMPTEAEWAYIARYPRGQAQRFSWGDEMPPPPAFGNFADQSGRLLTGDRLNNYDDGFGGSAPVGSFAANALGFFDLDGNVSEWVHDYYSIPVSTDVLVDPLGPAAGHQHVIRGASYMHGSRARLRLSYRDYANSGRQDLGFRIARYLE